MKYATLLLASLAIGLTAAGSARAQQQTFYRAKAAPSMPPKATPQPVNPYLLYDVCQGAGNGHAPGRPHSQPTRGTRPQDRTASRQQGHANPCASWRPNGRRPSHGPAPRHT